MPRGGDQRGNDELSRTLRQLRQAAGLSGDEAGGVAGFSQAKISRIEAGINVPTPKDVATLVKVYRAPADVQRRLVQLSEDMKAGTRRVVLNRGGTEFQRQFARIEEASEHIRTFTPTVVPGLLQTADYARAVFNSGALSPEEIDAGVSERMKRQELLGAAGHQFTLLTTAGALSWCAGSAAVMASQAERLARPQPPNVRIGITPWGRRATVFPMHSWDMYDQRAVSVGLVSSTALLTSPQDVSVYVEMFEKLEEMAVWDDAAREVFERISWEYRALV